MAFGIAERVNLHVPQADGDGPDLVVHAYRTGDIIYQQARPPLSERAAPAIAVLMGVALAVGLAWEGVQLGSQTADRWAAAACLVLGAVVGVVLRPGRGRRRPQPLSARALRRATSSLARALAEQYAREESGARLHDPGPLPVRWSAAPRGVGDHAVNLAGAGEAPPRLDGSFSGIVQTYEGLRHGRLVILGEAGAGKSVLVLHLANGLLTRRSDGDPVPVVIPISSWDPRGGTPLWWWAAGRLAEAHSGILAGDGAGASARSTAHRLITSGRVLPILDGFDELPVATRAKALAELCGSLLPDGRFVLTSRTAAFTDAMEAADLRLPRTAAVRLQPLEVADLRAYLPRTSREQDDATTKWDRLLDRLAALDTPPGRPGPAGDRDRLGEGAGEGEGDGVAAENLRDVLRTPLMVSLARAVYSDTTAHPDDLLNRRDLTTRDAVERHLLNSFVDAAYQSDPAGIPGRRDGWTSDRARRYLAWLAREPGQDIAWWRLEVQVPWAFRTLLVSLPLALLVGAAVAVTSLPAPGQPTVPGLGLRTGLLALIGAVCAGALDWIAAHQSLARPPQRLHSPRDAVLHALRRRPVEAVVSVLLPAGALAVWTWAVLSGNGVAILFAAFLLPIPLATINRTLAIVRRPADLRASDPVTLLREDRRAALALVPFALPPAPSFLLAHKVVLVPVVGTILIWAWGRGEDAVTPWRWTAVCCALALWWGLWNCAMSAWGRYTVARWWLASTGRLPLRLTGFLADAHRRGVLRQTGGVHRFRHIELQRCLAAGAGPENPENPGRGRRTGRAQRLRAGALPLLAGVTAVVTLAGSIFTAPGAMGPLHTLAPACDLLPLRSVRPLMEHPAVGGPPRIDIFSDALGFLKKGFRQPRRADPRAHARSSCVMTEQSALRPDSEVTLTVALAAGAGTVDSAERGRYEVDHPGLLETQVRSSGNDWSLTAGTERASSPDSRSLRADRHIPVGWARGRIANALVAVDVALEFGTEPQALRAAETLVREVLDRIRRTYDLPAGPVPEGQPLTRVPHSRISDDSRFGVFDEKRTARLAGAVWEKSEPARVETLGGLAAMRVPREAECDAPDGTRNAGADGGLTCTADHGPAAGFRMDLLFSNCGASCSASERRAFAEPRPGRPLADWEHRGTVAHDRSPGSVHLYWTVRATYQQGKNKPLPIEVLLWLDVSSPPPHQDLADKILNDLWAQSASRG
ncbi:NACHT domain-containing protein [Streptomyces sp. NBC_00090]|uniref:NACHT domain-containing protein n=1 Tax=Streptomyces sp. NBC_00090 TaxID=2903619 RepID=UPI00324BEFC5